MILRKIGQEERRIVLLVYPLLTTFIVMGLALPLFYVPLPGSSIIGLGAVALMGFVASLLMVNAYQIGEAAVVAPMPDPDQQQVVGPRPPPQESRASEKWRGTPNKRRGASRAHCVAH